MNKTLLNFLSRNDLGGYNVTPIQGDASDRKYLRLKKNTKTLILMDSSRVVNQVEDFVKVNQYLMSQGYSVPEIYFKDLKYGYMVLEDFGQLTVNQYLTLKPQMLEKVYEEIVEFTSTFTKLNDSPLPNFDKTFFLSELSYFRDYYFSYIGKKKNNKVMEDFYNAWEKPLRYIFENDPHNVFVHKDFHLGNLFWLPKKMVSIKLV